MGNGVAAILSFFIAGLGQLVKGQFLKGITIFVVFVVSAISVVGVPIAIIVWIWNIVDAYGGGSNQGSSGGMLTPKQVVALTKQEAKQFFEEGIEYAKAGNALMAEISYKRAIASDPTIADAHLNLSKYLLDKGLADDAEAHVNKAIELYGNGPANAYKISIAYNNLGAVELIRYNSASARNEQLAMNIHMANMRRHFETAIEVDAGNNLAIENLKKYAS